MGNIKNRHIIDSNNLSEESYFISILQEAYACGLLYDSDIENIQLQCIDFLAYKSERYDGGESSSIRVEVAENIMKSNLYTIGLYLKSLPDADSAVSELKSTRIDEIYKKGRDLIDEKIRTVKHIYKLAKKNKVFTLNYTYNATLDDNGIGTFFRSYNPDYEAHETPASIDYQLCNPVINLEGIEFIQKYLENLLIENEFCRNFDTQDIHYLLYGYDEGYKDLLINIFEHVLTAGLGCLLANKSIKKLEISEDEIQFLDKELSKDTNYSLALKLQNAAKRLIEKMNIVNPLVEEYIERSLPKITSNIAYGIKTNALDKVFVIPINPDLKQKIKFLSGVKMEDEDYRKLINQLLISEYSLDKIAIIKEKVESFNDLEDILFDSELNDEEMALVFDMLEDIEIAALIKRNPFKSDIQAVDLSEAEYELRLNLEEYINHLPIGRKEQIFEMVSVIIDE